MDSIVLHLRTIYGQQPVDPVAVSKVGIEVLTTEPEEALVDRSPVVCSLHLDILYNVLPCLDVADEEGIEATQQTSLHTTLVGQHKVEMTNEQDRDSDAQSQRQDAGSGYERDSTLLSEV